MKLWSDFSPYVRPFISGVPDKMIEEFVRRMVIDFCKSTSILKKNADSISVLSGTDEYSLVFSSDVVAAIAVVYASIGTTEIYETCEKELSELNSSWRTDTGSPTHRFMTSAGLVHLYPTPSADETDTLECEVIVKPSVAATSVDDFVFNDYAVQIGEGVLANLKRMPDKPWSDLQGAAIHFMEYKKGIVEAVRLGYQNRGLRPMGMTPVSFGGID